VRTPPRKRQPTDPGRRRTADVLAGPVSVKAKIEVLSPPSEPASTSPMARSIHGSTAAPAARVRTGKVDRPDVADDEVTVQRDSLSLGLAATPGSLRDFAPPTRVEPPRRFDDLDEETNVLLEHGPAIRKFAAAIDDSPTHGSESNGVSTIVDSTGPRGAAAAGGLPFPTLPALRVAVIATGGAGQVRVVALDGASPPPGAAAAILVPLSEADGATLAKLFRPR
jgi:hypothetical protein